MKQVNIHYAKTHLSQLLNEVKDGETVVIAKSGVPIVKLVPFYDKKQRREFGADRGLFEVPDDFNEPINDFESFFYDDESTH